MRVLCMTEGGWRGEEEGEDWEELGVGGAAGARGFMVIEKQLRLFCQQNDRVVKDT
jgi:hypothetical protein